MDLISVEPMFDLYNAEWPILTLDEPLPPAQVRVHAAGRDRDGVDSLISAGVIVVGRHVRRSVLSPGVRVRSHATSSSRC